MCSMTWYGWLEKKDAGVEARKTDPGSVNTLELLEIWSLTTWLHGFNFMELIDSQAQRETDFFLTPQMQLSSRLEKKNPF